MSNKLIASIIVIIAIGAGTYFYVTRPVATTPGDVENQVQRSEATTEGEHRYRIVSEESKASFTLHEDLRGTPTVVIGTTDQIAGDIIIKMDAPATISIGEIKVDARTLKTDNEQRNGALVRLILKSEDESNRYIVFKTKTVTGVPEVIVPGESFTMKIVGDATIKGVTKEVTFNGTGTLTKDNTFTASADTVVTYADFGISVPNFPFLANVDSTAKLAVSIVGR